METSNTRERILGAAVDVLAQRGYSSAGVQEIVELSGTSKGSFYFHFPSKEQMVMALVERMSAKLISKVQRSVQKEVNPVHRVVTSIDVLVTTFARQRKVAQVLLLSILGHGRDSDRKFLPVRERFTDLIRQELDIAVEQGYIEPVDTILVSQMWIGALHEVILRWLLIGDPNPLTIVIPTLRATLLRSIGINSDSV
jgi:TetR/AcrR family fatty acid metabolism transcriptional regulator